jgi:hypothetical protein
VKRLLLLAAVGAGAALVPAPALAGHLCVTSNGRDVVCAPHVDLVSEDPICVTRGGDPVVCV